MPAPERRDITLTGDGVSLHAVAAGDPTGRPVLLLHGFPEFWYSWRHQLGPLAEAGFHAVAPDQRGYNLSDKPPRVADYAIDRLAADAAACIAGMGVSRAAVVGHDWGGAVAWWLALTRPELVSRLVIINCPHPVAFRKELFGNPRQFLRSWYMLVMQMPWLPERLFGRRNGRPLARALRNTSRPGTFTEDDLTRYRETWGRPGAIRGMINWYRAGFRDRASPPSPRVTVPTLIIWGGLDRFLGRRLADRSLVYCDAGRLERIDDATHWVHHEEPARVNRLLVDFLGPVSG